MKAIMVTYDSLNRRFLSPYGCDWVKTPNFQRLSEKCVTFDRCYVGSLPCMPARRELHTGRYNFLHRSWGPMEPFDDSMPEILKNNNIHSHLTSDHGHYWEDGGCTYHTRYSSWECHRGQEGDPWKAIVGHVDIPEHLGRMWRRDIVNRKYIQSEAEQPQTKTFESGLEFLDTNHNADNWFLHVETFDPHEPFYVMPEYQELYESDYKGPFFDWPLYQKVQDKERPYIEHVRNMYAALVTMCDRNLGKILDKMDQYNLWQDTMLIVNTDHGFLLGEHDWWAKTPEGILYDDVSRTPLFLYDPRSKKKGRCDCLVQTIDLAPTVLEYFNLLIPKDMKGFSLKDTIADNLPIRKTALFGVHGKQIACTDGDYTYIRAPKENNSPLYNYTLMPTHMKCMYTVKELKDLELSEPFSFTKGCKLMKTADYDYLQDTPSDGKHNLITMLLHTKEDPLQLNPVQDPEKEEYYINEILKHLQDNDAPKEQYIRMGLWHDE